MEISRLFDRSSPDALYLWPLFCILSAIAFKLWRRCNIQLDAGEPPIVRPTIPYIGHLWGLMRQSHVYLSILCQNTPHPIFTIPVAFGKAYVVNSPSLAQSVFRSKSLSFAPFVIEFVERMDDLSQPAKHAYAHGLHTQVMQIFAARLSGESLKRVSAVSLQEVVRQLPGYHSEVTGLSEDLVQQRHLWFWIRDVMTIATTSALLGVKNNPWIEKPSLVEDYWTFEAGDPSGRASIIDVSDRDCKKSKNAMVDALTAYFDLGCSADNKAELDETVSQLTIDTVAAQRLRGFTTRELGAAYVTIIHAAVVNMVPTLFWCIAYVFSRPSLTARLREELIAAVSIEVSQSVHTKQERRNCFIDTDRLNYHSPLLLSVVRETQRLVAVGTFHRRVLEDTTVCGEMDHEGNVVGKQTFLLKKGTSMLLPVANNHRNPFIWGENSNQFDADRFLVGGCSTEAIIGDRDSATDRARKMAYFPFGGGKELCPGRNFATTEVLSTVAVLVLGYDIMAADGGSLRQPAFAPSKMTEATAKPHPTADLNVSIERRKGWEDIVWAMKSSEK